MRSPVFTINSCLSGRRGRGGQIRFFAFGFVLALFLSFQTEAQRLSILTPEKDPQNTLFVSNFRGALEKKFTVINDSLSEAAYSATVVADPYNMITSAARNIAAAIGCDYFALIRTATQRRVSLERPPYYEASAAIYIVSSMTGRLVYWKLLTFESDTPGVAGHLLANSAESLVPEISGRLRDVKAAERSERPSGKIEEMPAENSPEAKSFRPPVPYRRVKPEYTRQASLYGVTATVDLLLDLDEKGNIMRTEIVRWAGYGLDEAVTDAVRKMNWRPAERNGKPLSLRVLLRYNFKKVEKEESSRYE